MSDNYIDTLNKSWGDIPEPKTLPVGTWLLRGRNVAVFPPAEEGKSARVAFFYEAVEPMDNVNGDELAALGDDYSFAENDIVKQFFINRSKDWWAVRKHLELHGIAVEEGMTIPETFKLFKGTEVYAYLSTKTFTNGAGETKIDNDPVNFSAL